MVSREIRRRACAAIIGALALTALLAGCVPAAKDVSAAGHDRAAHVTRTHTPKATPSDLPTPSPTPTPVAPPNPAISHPATPEPVSTPVPSPILIPVPRGTVVAEGDVASPKGSIHFHFQMIANGDNTYIAQYSRFTSTLPVPVSVTLLEIAPRVGDGLTYHGVGDHLLGGATTSAAPTSSVSLGPGGQPSYLGTLVTYSSAPSGAIVPVEIRANKVLGVNSVHWKIPVRQSNVHPVDGGTRAFASGAMTSKTAAGAPRRYLVAPGDITSVVAERFGISIEDLIWLNKNLQVFGDQQYLYEGTTLNLDPDSL
ncbi:LysM domain-containing protein [Leifsonia poae]|uniref:LysM domain-containing protein n=1 Tax=Leifsonia poae TaxID=110933 RepID=UPI003D678C41